MKKFKTKNLLIAALSLLCAVMLCCSIVLFSSVSGKTATAKTPTASDIVIGEIAPNAGDSSSSSNIKKLYSVLTGNGISGQKVLSDVETYFNSNARPITGTGSTVKALNTIDLGTNIFVTFGGIQWNVVYLTLNNSGELILDLWQSEPSIANSPFSDGISTNDTSLNNPSCIYGTSYMSCQVLGNGGDYYNYDNSSVPVLKTSDPTTSFYYEFTQGKYSDFIETPENIEYQEKQSIPELGIYGYNYPNDAWGVPLNDSCWGSINYGPTGLNKTGYDGWKDDKVWLPSWCETGASNYGAGIWGNPDARVTNTTQDASWFRSGLHYAGFSPSTTCFLDVGGTVGAAYAPSNSLLAVRPAIHLNLNAIGIQEPINVEVVYNGTAQTIADVAADKKIWYESDKMTLDYVDAPMTDVGEYKVKATLTQMVLDQGLTFVGEPDTSQGESATVRYFTFKIKPKPLDATLAEANGVVTLTVDSTGLCGSDSLPNTAIQYTSTDGRGYNSTTAPQQKGDFKAEPKITDTNSNYSLNCTPASINFTIDSIKVSLPTLPPTATPEYDGTQQTVTLSGYTHNGKGVNIFSVTGKTASNKNVATAPTFNTANGEITFKDAGTYTVTLTLEDAANCVWQADGSTGRKDITFTVKQKQLTVAVGNDNNDLWSWGIGTAVNATVTVSGIVTGDNVKLTTMYTASTGADIKSNGTSNGGSASVSDVMNLPGNLVQGSYTLSAEIDNENYSLTDGLVGAGMPLTFTIGAVVFDPDTFTWVYSENNATGTQPIQDGDNFLKYKLDAAGNPFEYTLSINLGANAGVFRALTDTDYTSRKQFNAGTYTTTVRLTIKNSDYSFDTNKTYTNATIISTTEADVFINWTIEKGDFTGLENLPWVYRYGTGNWTDYNASRPPEFGNGTVTVKMKGDVEGTLKGLTFNYGGVNSERNKGNYTVRMSFGVTDTQNFNIPQGFNFEWEISKKIINVQWEQDVAITYNGTQHPEWQGNEYYATQLRYEKAEFADKVEYIYSCTLPDGTTYSGRGIEALAYITEQALAAQRRIEVDVTVELKSDASIMNDYELVDSTGGNFSTSFMVGDNKLAAKVELTASGEYGNFNFNVTVTGEDMDSSKYTVTVYKGTNISDPDDASNTKIENFDPSTADAGNYFIVVTLTGSWGDEYRLTGKIKTFEILPKAIDLPSLNDIIFTGGDINLVDYLTGFDQNLMAFVAGSEFEGLRNVSENGYVAKLSLTNPNYCWKYDGNNKVVAKHSLSDYEINKLDSSTAVYKWNIAPLILDTSNMWSKGKGGATLNLPQNIRDLITAGTLELGYRYYDADGNFVETPELKGGRSFKVEAVFGGDDSVRNVQFKTGDATIGNTSPALNYTVPQSGAAAVFGSIKDFMTKTWLGLPVWAWFLIGLAILILLIIIIVVAVKRRKTKEEREEKKAAKQAAKEEAAAKKAEAEAQREAERARIEAEREAERLKLENQREAERMRLESQREIEKMRAEAEAAKAKAEAEAEIAKMKAQAQAQMAQPMAMPQQMPQQIPMQQQYAQQPQMQQMPVQQQYAQQQAMPQQMPQPAPQPQYVQQQQPVNNNELEEIKKQLKRIRAEQRAQRYGQPMAMPMQAPAAQQMPMQYAQPQYGAAMSPSSLDANALAMAKLEAKLDNMHTEQSAVNAARMEAEFAKMRADMYGNVSHGQQPMYMPMPQMQQAPAQPQYAPQPVIQQAPVQAAVQPQAQAQAADANNPTMLGEVLASMVRSLAAGQVMQEAAVTSEPQPVKEVKTVSEQPAVNAVPSQSIYPPDAVITTTTTVDTTKAAAKSVAEAERDSRETFFDIDGFYDKFEG